jgi:hypothetical protein
MGKSTVFLSESTTPYFCKIFILYIINYFVLWHNHCRKYCWNLKRANHLKRWGAKLLIYFIGDKVVKLQGKKHDVGLLGIGYRSLVL